MATEHITFEPALLEALNKQLMRIVGESNESDYLSKMLTPEERESLASAANAYKTRHYQIAVTNYKTCVSTINKTYTNDNESSKADVTLQYMLCKCLIHSQRFQDLIEARTMLTELESSVGKIYPMIYHGLAELNMKIFCFDEAEQFITKGFTVMRENTNFPECYIPETNDLIPESTKQHLTEELLSLRDQCSGWHPPDAKCFMDNCENVAPSHVCGRNIFIKSPAFSGMVTLTCSNAINPCTITFHSACWRIKKDEVSLGMKIPEKDIICNWLCLTPNCGNEDDPSVIKQIKIQKGDGILKIIEAPVEKLSRSTYQQNSVSKGAIRKQKPMNKTSTPKKASKIKSVLSTNNNSIHVTNNNHPSWINHNSQVNSNVKNNSWINEVPKETPRPQEPQRPPLVDPMTMKLMKMITLREANFNIEFGNDWRSDEAYYGNEHMISTIGNGYEPDFADDSENVARRKSFLFSYFNSYIESRGPVKNDELLQEWLSITESIGGCETVLNDLNSIIDVRNFFLQSLRFVAVGDYICLPSLLPGAYALVQEEVYHKVMTVMEKGDSEVHSKNERKKKEKKKSINESNPQIKEEEIVQASSEKLKEIDAEINDPFLLTPEDLLDVSGSDEDNSADNDSPESSVASCRTPIEVIEDEKHSEIAKEEEHVNENQGGKIIENSKVRRRIFVSADAGETLGEIQDEGTQELEESIDNDESEIEDSTDGSKSGCTEVETEDASSIIEGSIETGDKNVSEESEVEDCQRVETEDEIDENGRTEVEIHEAPENMQKKYYSDQKELSERYVIENESNKTSDEEDDPPDEDNRMHHPIESLTPIREEDSLADVRNVYRGGDDTDGENDDSESSCSETINEVMTEFINMSNNKSQSFLESLEPTKRSERDIIAEQAATIKELSEELQETRNELEKTTKELLDMKMKMLKKSLDGQYNSNQTYVSCKVDSLRNEYAIVAKLQNMVFNTVGTYLNINWQDWAVSLENLEKIRSSLQDECTKLAQKISTEKYCDDINDVRLNILNVPPLPQHNLPNLIEMAFNMMKHHVQQSAVSCQPRILPAQNPHIPPLMSFWYQQTQFVQQSLPSAPYHQLINPLVASTQVQQAVAASPKYPSSTVTMMNPSPPATVKPVSPNIPFVIGQPLMKLHANDGNGNALTCSSTLKPCLPVVPSVSASKSTVTSRESSTSPEACKESTGTELVKPIPDPSSVPKSKHEVSTHTFTPELVNSGQFVLSNAPNSTPLPKIRTPSVFSEDSRFSSQWQKNIVSKDTVNNKTPIPRTIKNPKSMDPNVKKIQTGKIETKTHDRLTGKNESAKSRVEVTAQLIESKAQISPQALKEPVPLKTESIIKKEVKPIEKSAQKPTEKKTVIEKSQKDSQKAIIVPVSAKSETKMSTPFLTCKNTSTSELVSSTSSSEVTGCLPECVKDESLRATKSSPTHSVVIKESAPVKEKALPKVVQEDDNSERSKKEEREKSAEIKEPILKYEEPSTSGRVTIANGHSKVKTPEKSKMRSADKLMSLLRKKHVGVLEYDLLYSVQTVRKNHNDTLSGLSFSQIIGEASQVINKRQKPQLIAYLPNNGPTCTKNLNSHVVVKTERPRNDSISSTSSASSFQREITTKMNPWVKPQDVCWTKDSPEVECIICMEVLISCNKEATYTLKCQHTFHKQCIRIWFKQNQSCPNCRIHSTIDDEFPPLP